LKEPIKVCKICSNNIFSPSFYSLIHSDNCVCNTCLEKIKPSFIEFKHNKYKGLSIYSYNEDIKALIYQIKGCYDIELIDALIFLWKRELHNRYSGYTLVPIPSYFIEDEKREFNHVYDIFSRLDLPIIKVLEKTDNYKQSDHKKAKGTIYQNTLKCLI